MTNPNLTEDITLHQAIAKGDMKAVQDLVLSGADIEEKNSRGQSPLHFAVTEYQILIIEFLIQQGAKIDEKDTNGDNPLLKAVSRCYIPIVNILIKNGADIEATSGANLITPLHIASQSGHLEIVQMLITKGAKIDTKDINGYEP